MIHRHHDKEFFRRLQCAWSLFLIVAAKAIATTTGTFVTSNVPLQTESSGLLSDLANRFLQGKENLARRMEVERNDPFVADSFPTNRHLFSHHHHHPHHHHYRHLQSATTGSSSACNDILFSWTVAETQTNVGKFLNAILPANQSTTTSIDTIIVSQVQFGIRAQKICAACTDYASDLGATPYCASNAYGASTAQSGLVFLPTVYNRTSNRMELASGTRMPTIYNRGTRTNTEPSMEGANSSELFFSLMIAATQGTVAILPDFMGYGESMGISYRAYIIQQAYRTATIPLVWRTRDLIEQETSCTTTLSDATVVSGYSEGGYAAVAVASALHDLGKTIVQVYAGGGPYALSSVQLLAVFREMQNGEFPNQQDYFVALLGSSFSSTYTDLPNYGIQNALNAESRDALVSLDNNGSNINILNGYLNATGDVLSVINHEWRNFTYLALQANNTDPCSPNSTLPGKPVYLCNAFREQDLTDTLLAATFPIQLCASKTDLLVNFGNVPDISLNPTYLSLHVATGTHEQAGAECLMQVFMFFLGGMGGFQIPHATCSAGRSGAPPFSTTNSTTPTMAPLYGSLHPTSFPAPINTTSQLNITGASDPSGLGRSPNSTTLAPTNAFSTRPTSLSQSDAPSVASAISGAPSVAFASGISDAPSSSMAALACQNSSVCTNGKLCNNATGACVYCLSTSNCDFGLECNTSIGECVPIMCKSNSDCNGLVCDVATGSCVHTACHNDTDCVDTGEYCNTTTGDCVSCISNAQCHANQRCNTTSGQCVGLTCSSNSDCKSGSSCDFISGTCVSLFCSSDNQCSSGLLCNNSTGACVTCISNASCALVEQCNVTSGECVPLSCSSSNDCNGFVCNSSGQCVSGTGNLRVITTSDAAQLLYWPGGLLVLQTIILAASIGWSSRTYA